MTHKYPGAFSLLSDGKKGAKILSCLSPQKEKKGDDAGKTLCRTAVPFAFAATTRLGVVVPAEHNSSKCHFGSPG